MVSCNLKIGGVYKVHCSMALVTEFLPRPLSQGLQAAAAVTWCIAADGFPAGPHFIPRQQ